jgi:hypothetical protein
MAIFWGNIQLFLLVVTVNEVHVYSIVYEIEFRSFAFGTWHDVLCTMVLVATGRRFMSNTNSVGFLWTIM